MAAPPDLAFRPRRALLYSMVSPLDLNSVWRICDRHLPNSSRIICWARPSGRRALSASSPWASRQAQVASTTSQEMHEDRLQGRAREARGRRSAAFRRHVRARGQACHAF